MEAASPCEVEVARGEGAAAVTAGLWQAETAQEK